MTPETLILAMLIALVLLIARFRRRLLADVWRSASWWERVVLVLALAPIPGPLEEIAGLLVARRVASRRRRYGSPTRSFSSEIEKPVRASMRSVAIPAFTASMYAPLSWEQPPSGSSR